MGYEIKKGMKLLEDYGYPLPNVVHGVELDEQVSEKLEEQDAERRGHSLYVFTQFGRSIKKIVGGRPVQTKYTNVRQLPEKSIVYGGGRGDTYQMIGGKRRLLTRNPGSKRGTYNRHTL